MHDRFAFLEIRGLDPRKGMLGSPMQQISASGQFSISLWALYTRPSALPGTDSPGFGSFGRDWLSFTASPSRSRQVLIWSQSFVLAFPVLPFNLRWFQVLPALGLSPQTPLSALTSHSEHSVPAAQSCLGVPQGTSASHQGPPLLLYSRPAAEATPGIQAPETQPLASSAIPAPPCLSHHTVLTRVGGGCP